MPWQERAAALAEGKPAPPLSGSTDIRSLNMDDFKQAHERVYEMKNDNSLSYNLLHQNKRFNFACYCHPGMRKCIL